MPHVCAFETIQADADAVYALFCHAELFPQFMPNVLAVRTLQRGGGWSLTQWDTELDGAPLSWQEVDRFDAEGRVISFCLTEGDITKFEGRWSFQPNGEGTACTCELEYELGVSVIEDAVGPIIREKVKANLETMFQAAKERLEAVPCA